MIGAKMKLVKLAYKNDEKSHWIDDKQEKGTNPFYNNTPLKGTTSLHTTSPMNASTSFPFSIAIPTHLSTS